MPAPGMAGLHWWTWLRRRTERVSGRCQRCEAETVGANSVCSDCADAMGLTGI